MGHNFGAIYVKAGGGLTQDTVVTHVETYWLDRGAKRRTKGLLSVEPMTIDDGGDKLSLAVSPTEAGWIAILDSERYTASAPLAEHLSKVLDAEVLVFEISDVSNSADYQRFASGRELPRADDDDASSYSATYDFLETQNLPWFGLTFDGTTKKEWDAEGFRVFGFSKVDDDAYFGAAEDDSDEDDGIAPPSVVADRDTAVCNAAWPIYEELVAGTPDMDNLSHDFREAALARIYPDHSWADDLPDFGHLLCTAKQFARALAIADRMFAYDPDTRWRRIRADALLGLERWRDAEADLRFLLFTDADISDTYDRMAHYLALSGRGDPAELTATKLATQNLYTRNNDLWKSEERERAAKPRAKKLKPAAAAARLAAFVRDELGDWQPTAHASSDLRDFVAWWTDRLGKPDELAAIVQRAQAELARREDVIARAQRAAEAGDTAALTAALSELPHAAEDESTIGKLAAGTDDARHALLAYAVDGGYLYVLGELLDVAHRLGKHAECAGLLIPARWRAHRDSAIHHSAARIAARVDVPAALDFVRGAREFYCPTFPEMRTDPALAPLRDHPAFRAAFADYATRPVRAYDDEPYGKRELLVRDHVIAAFFVPGKYARVGGRLAQAFEAFLGFVPANQLAFGRVGANSTRYNDQRPFDDKLLGRVRAQLDPVKSAKKDMVFAEVFGPEPDIPGFFAAVTGTDDSDLNAIEMWFPVEHVTAIGYSALRAWLDTLASELPTAYGFATLALSPLSFYSSNSTMEARLAALARWHVGFDLVHTSELRSHLAGKVAGAKWLTYLDDKRLDKLGGLAALRRALPMIQIDPIDKGAALQAGDAPDRGDHQTFANRDAFRALHAALAPIMHFDWGFNGALDAYPGGADAWLARYLDGPIAKPTGNPILAGRSNRAT